MLLMKLTPDLVEKKSFNKLIRRVPRSRTLFRAMSACNAAQPNVKQQQTHTVYLFAAGSNCVERNPLRTLFWMQPTQSKYEHQRMFSTDSVEEGSSHVSRLNHYNRNWNEPNERKLEHQVMSSIDFEETGSVPALRDFYRSQAWNEVVQYKSRDWFILSTDIERNKVRHTPKEEGGGFS